MYIDKNILIPLCMYTHLFVSMQVSLMGDPILAGKPFGGWGSWRVDAFLCGSLSKQALFDIRTRQILLDALQLVLHGTAVTTQLRSAPGDDRPICQGGGKSRM